MSNSTTDPLQTQQEINDSQYGYVPTLWIAALFVSLYGLSSILHLTQAVYYRLWWLFPTAILAGIGETIGWSGRLWSAKNPAAQDPFMMQISSTIISPTPLVAANFIILGRVIRALGPQYSRLSPKWYTIIFCSCDVVALVIQAIGGGTASAADNDTDAKKGGNIMLAGIAFQLIAIVVYAAFAGEFLFRYAHDRPLRSASPTSTRGSSSTLADGAASPRTGEPDADKEVGTPSPATARGVAPGERTMLGALVFSTLVIFIRSVYRLIELGDGWDGRIIHTQVYFDVLDGAMITLAIYTLNIFHPGRLLSR